MQRLSISELSSFRWNFFQDVVRYSNLGVEAIGVWRSKLDEYGIEQAADLLNEMRMDVSSLSWTGGFTGSNGCSHKFAVEDAIQAVYQAHMIGATNLVLHPGGRNNHTQSYARRLVRDGINEILPVASDLGIKLVIEPVVTCGNPWSFLTTAEDYLSLIQAWEPQQVGLVLDLFNVGLSPDFHDLLINETDRIAIVQLADGRCEGKLFVRCLLGTGCIPVDQWLQTVAETGFEGEVEIELHGCRFENHDYRRSLQCSCDYFTRAMDRSGSNSTR